MGEHGYGFHDGELHESLCDLSLFRGVDFGVVDFTAGFACAHAQ